MTVVSVRIDESLDIRLENIGKISNRKKGYLMREAIEMAIEDLEDRYEAENALRDIMNGKEELLDIDEVFAEYGLSNINN